MTKSTIRLLEQSLSLPTNSAIVESIGHDAPNVADYFGVWAIYPQVFLPLVERVNSMDLRAHVANPQSALVMEERNSRKPYQMTTDGVALISIVGPTQKTVGSLQEGTSTVRVRQQLRQAAADDSVRGAMLILDTPGGAASGNSDLAAEVARFGQSKPIHAYGEDMVASAGVSVASQAGRITANCASCLYGCLGTFAVVMDSSKAAEKLGVKVHVIKADGGAYKGMGTPGTEITGEQLEEMQRITNALNANYVRMIARGRGLSEARVRQMADGRIHPAAEALELGLIDAVESFDAAYSALMLAIDRPSSATAARQTFVHGDDGDDDDGDEMRAAAGAADDDDMQADDTDGDGDTDADTDDDGDTTDGADDGDDQPDDGEPEEMAENPATTQQLRESFPESSAEWREKMTIAGATLSQAAIEYANELAAENARLRESASQAEPLTRSSSAGIGVAPLTLNVDESEQYSGDPVQDFTSAVEQRAGANAGYEKRMQAVRAVAKANPQLHQAYLLATNPGRRQQRQIAEKAADFADA